MGQLVRTLCSLPGGGNTPTPRSAPAPHPWPGSISTSSQGSSRRTAAACLYYKDLILPACATSLQASPRSRAQIWELHPSGVQRRMENEPLAPPNPLHHLISSASPGPASRLPPRLARAALSPAARCPRLLSQPVPRDGRSKIFHALLSSPAFPLASFSPVSPA